MKTQAARVRPHYIGIFVPNEMYDALLARQQAELRAKRKTGVASNVSVSAIVRLILSESLEVNGTMGTGRPRKLRSGTR